MEIITGFEHAASSTDGLNLMVIFLSFFGLIFGQLKLPLAILGLLLRLLLWVRNRNQKKRWREAEG